MINSASVFHFLFQQSIYAGIVFVMVAAALRVLRLQHPQWQYAAWSLVFIRLVMPLDFAHALSLRVVLSNFIQHLFPKQTPSLISSTFTATPGAMLPPQASALTTPLAQNFQSVLIVAWLLGVAILAAVFFLRRVRFYRLARQAAPAPESLFQQTKIWQRRFRIRRSVRLKISESVSTAFTLGVFRPMIVLPADPAGHTDAVLAHELAHIRRCDDVWIVLQNVISIFYFFHPAVWLASRQIYISRECICDSMVLTHRHIDRSAYGQSLINSITVAPKYAAGVGTLGFGGTKRAMKIRIRNLKETRMLKNSRWLFLSLVITAVFILPMAGISLEDQSTASTTTETTVQFTHPLVGQTYRLTSAYGMRIHPISKKEVMHRGTDWAAKTGTPVSAAAAGTVTFVKTDYEHGKGHGLYLDIQHANGFTTRYTQLSAIDVKVGQVVAAGEKIAEVGSTGLSTAPHLHFELWKDSEHMDPQSLIKE